MTRARKRKSAPGRRGPPRRPRRGRARGRTTLTRRVARAPPPRPLAQLGGTACPLSRGLSHANVDTASGKITRVVDIAEAPWRVVGLLLAPLVAALSATAGVAQTAVTEVSRPQPEGLADGPPRLR